MYGAQNDKAKAIAWVEKELETGFSFLLLHYSDPLMGDLLDDPDYRSYESKIFDVSAFQKPKTQKKELIPTDEVEQYLQKLYKKLSEEYLFLDANLSLKSLAEKLRMHPNQLSWLINEKTDKNFNQFINSYRVKAFQAKALDPQYSHLSILGLALESGFNSKTVFNTYFKKELGMTPKAWIEKSSEL